MFEGVADQHGVELRVASLPAVCVAGNRHHLSQVVNNLLDNALKFTAPVVRQNSSRDEMEARATVEVSLFVDETIDEVQLKVHDTGIGIEAEHLSHVFDRFYRVDRSRSRDEAMAGSGLGLAICKAFVEAHDGTITVRSQAGEGSVFVVTLPMVRLLSNSKRIR
jgi:two-component system, OmpR family, heavy metal sensor histidine kinase CusS